MKMFKEYNFKFEQNDKVFKTLENNTEKVVDDLSKMNDQLAIDQKRFVASLKEVNESFVADNKAVREE